MKKRLREMTWDDYGISINRYKELKAFCLQYDEKKTKINRGISAVNQDGGSSGGTPDKIERQAIRNITFQKECEMIEQAAIKASPDIYPYIIKSVTKDLSYSLVEWDEYLGRITVGKTEFYALRRLFYHHLDELKG